MRTYLKKAVVVAAAVLAMSGAAGSAHAAGPVTPNDAGDNWNCSTLSSSADHLNWGQCLTPGRDISTYTHFGQTHGVDLRYTSDGSLIAVEWDLPFLGSKRETQIWDSNTHGTSPGKVVMQNDGNLVIYNADHKSVWASGTSNCGANWARIQDDGNFVIYRPHAAGENADQWRAVWSSKFGDTGTVC